MKKDKAEATKSKGLSTRTEVVTQWSRRFQNPDLSTCWLNSCLQLILASLDHAHVENQFQSELGIMLSDLTKLDPGQSIDPTNIKNIIIFAEDMRIAKRKSEITDKIKDKNILSNMLRNIDQTYLNLKSGQQCVRDFFICLKENMEDWMDIYNMFNFTAINLSICMACGYRSTSEQPQIYLEVDVPPDGSNLNEYVEKNLNDGIMVEYRCEDGCNAQFRAEKRTLLKSVEDTQFLIVMLRRSIVSEFGLELLPNNVYPEGAINIR